MLSRVSGRLTGDIDIISEGMNSDVRRAAEAVALDYNLAPDWINDGAKGFAVRVDVRPDRIFTGMCLVVDAVGAEYLLAMKLLSGRDDDADDCVHLIRETGIYGKDRLMDLMQSAAGLRRLRPRDEYWAAEMLALALKGRLGRSVRGWFVSAFKMLSMRRTRPKRQAVTDTCKG